MSPLSPAIAPIASGRDRPADEHVAYLDAVHAQLSALLQSFRREPPRDIEARMRDAALELRRIRQLLRLRPRTPVRLFELERRFRLNEFEAFALSMLATYMLSGELRQEIATISETRMDYVSLELLLRLFYPTRAARMAGLREFTGGTLLTEQLVQVAAARTPAELLFAPIDLQPHTAHYLLGGAVLRETPPLDCEVTPPRAEPFAERALGEHLRAVCRELAAPRILLLGPAGAGKATLGRQLAGQLDRELITLSGPTRNALWPALVAKVRLHDALVLFRGCPELAQSPSQAFLDALDRMDVPVMFACPSGIEVTDRLRRRMHVVVRIEDTTADERARLWRAHLAQAFAAPVTRELEHALDEIVATFTLTRTQIIRAVAALRQQSPALPDLDQLQQACERQRHP